MAYNEAFGHDIDWQVFMIEYLRGRAAMCLLSLAFCLVPLQFGKQNSFSRKC